MKIRGHEVSLKVLLPSTALVIGALLSPWWLRTVPFFELRQIEVSGARYLTAEGLIAQLDLPEGFNVFSDLDEVERRVEALPGVIAASVERALPASILIRVQEREPVALYPTETGFRSVDAEGRRLPYDPTVVALDLPLVSAPELALIRTAASIRAAAPELFEIVLSISFGSGSSVVVNTGGFDMLFADAPGWDRVAQVATVLGYLNEQNEAFSQIDARYDGSVVVRS